MTTRGEFAQALFDSLGLEASTSNSVFSDAGGTSGVLNALYDAGITTGVGDGRFGIGQDITRGQAFTMLARAYGLTDSSTGIDGGVQALVDAGIVKGYGNTGNIGADDILNAEHIPILMERMAALQASQPEAVTPVTPGTVTEGEDKRLDEQVMADPTFAAALRGFGLSESQIRSAHDYQVTAVQSRIAEMADIYGRQQEQAEKGVNQAWENRGLTRSGGRLTDLNESRNDINNAMERSQNDAYRQIDTLGLDMASQLADLNLRRAEAEADARLRLGEASAQKTIDEYNLEVNGGN